MNRIEWLIITIVAVLLVSLVIPSGKGAGSGHYDLFVDVISDPSVQSDSIRFAKAWTLEDAEKQIKDDQLSLYYVPQVEEDNQRYRLSISYSVSYKPDGLQGWFRQPEKLKVKHPKFLIVEFRTEAHTQVSSHRKRYTIPEDRKQNEISITLP